MIFGKIPVVPRVWTGELELLLALKFRMDSSDAGKSVFSSHGRKLPKILISKQMLFHPKVISRLPHDLLLVFIRKWYVMFLIVFSNVNWSFKILVPYVIPISIPWVVSSIAVVSGGERCNDVIDDGVSCRIPDAITLKNFQSRVLDLGLSPLLLRLPFEKDPQKQQPSQFQSRLLGLLTWAQTGEAFSDADHIFHKKLDNSFFKGWEIAWESSGMNECLNGRIIKVSFTHLQAEFAFILRHAMHSAEFAASNPFECRTSSESIDSFLEFHSQTVYGEPKCCFSGTCWACLFLLLFTS